MTLTKHKSNLPFHNTYQAPILNLTNTKLDLKINCPPSKFYKFHLLRIHYPINEQVRDFA